MHTNIITKQQWRVTQTWLIILTLLLSFPLWSVRTLLAIASSGILHSKKNKVEEQFYYSSGHSLLLSYNLFSFQLPELWKSKYFNKSTQGHCSVLDTSVSLMLRSNPAPAFSHTAVCTSSHHLLFQCHIYIWGNSIKDGGERHQQLSVYYQHWMYFVCSQDARIGIDLYGIIKY